MIITKKLSYLFFLLILNLLPLASANEIVRFAENGDIESVKACITRDPTLVSAKLKDGNTALHAAAQEGHLEIVQYLISKGAFPSVRNQKWMTPLALAVREGRTEVVEFLLTLMVDVNEELPQKYTYLFGAAEKGYLPIVKMLVEEGAEINKPALYDATPLQISAARGYSEVCKFLIGKGAKVDVFTAAALGDLDTLKKLVEDNPKLLTQKDEFDIAPLLFCASTPETAEYLLSKGSSLNELCDLDRNILHYSALYSRTNMLKFYMEKDLDIDEKDVNGHTPFFVAAREGQLKSMQYLWGIKRTDLNYKDYTGNPMICWAAQNNHYDVVEWLLENGANIDALNGKGCTALAIAIEKKHKGVVRLLLKKGAAPIRKKEKDATALIYFATNSHMVEAVNVLLDKGLDVNSVDKNGFTLLHCAISNDSTDLAKLFIEKGAEVQTKLATGHTPLHSAALRGYLDIVKLLIEKGAKIDVLTNKQKTPIDLALKKGHQDVAEFLKEELTKQKAAENEKQGK